MNNGKYIADVIFPDDETLVSKILEFGTGVKVVAPTELKKRIRAQATEIAKLYLGK